MAGWNGSKDADAADRSQKQKNNGGTSSGVVKGLLGGLVVVIAALAVGYWVLSGDKSTSKVRAEKKPSNIKEVKPAVAPKDAEKVAAPEKVELPKEMYPGEKIISSETNSSGYVTNETVDEKGGRHVHIHCRRSIWPSSTDAMLANVLSVKPGALMAPLPAMGPEMDERFRESLKHPITVKPDDAENVKLLKQFVQSAREEIKERMANGEHFSDILLDARKLHNENGKIREDAVAELKKIRESGDEDGARVYAQAVNQSFEKMGIKPLPVDPVEQSSGGGDHRRHLKGKVK